MIRQSGFPAAVSSLPAWSILFAREPEEDMDLDELDDENKAETDDTGSQPDEPEPDKSSRPRPLMLALLAVVAVGGGYLAMNPDVVMDLMGQGTEVEPQAPVPAAPTAAHPVPPSPKAMVAPAVPAPPASPAPAIAPPGPVSPQAKPAPPAAPAAPSTPPVQTAKAGPVPVAPATPAPPAPAASVSQPLFGEGQLVTVVPDSMLPAAAVSLSSDAGRTRPGPLVSPTAVLTVVDGEFRGNSWVYAVRTPQGTTGWIAEKQLKAAKR